MGTRSKIIVKVRKEDIGKKVSFDRSKLPLPLIRENWPKDRSTEYIPAPDDEPMAKDVLLHDDYVGIYCQFDGYITGGNGDILMEFFNNYDKALNLALCGVVEGIDEQRGVILTDRRKNWFQELDGEGNDGITPYQSSRPELPYPANNYSFKYLFKDDRWYVYHWNLKEEFGTEFVPLDEVREGLRTGDEKYVRAVGGY